MNRPEKEQVAVQKELICAVPKSRVRDRIMQTASELFYQRGIRAVGVDAIASEAGTNKMSFYRNFASKDELVAEYLRGEEREAWGWWDQTVAKHLGDPRLQIASLFEALVENAEDEDCRGCALANAAVEITEPHHPARPIVEKYKAELRRRFRQIAHELGAREADELGDALMLLWEGSYLSCLTFPGQNGPLHGAAKTAQVLIAAYTN
jgi:AcrR family transcriptional regulator